MRKLTLLILLLFCPLAFSQEKKIADTPAPVVKVPKVQADKIKEIESAIQAVQKEAERRINELKMVESNLLLDSALELHLSKTEFEALTVRIDEKGDLYFVPKEKK